MDGLKVVPFAVVNRFKMKVGSDVNDDIRRAAIFREEIGWDNFLVSFTRLRQLWWGPH